MRKINDILRKNNISGCKYCKNGKCIIIDSKEYHNYLLGLTDEIKPYQRNRGKNRRFPGRF